MSKRVVVAAARFYCAHRDPIESETLEPEAEQQPNSQQTREAKSYIKEASSKAQVQQRSQASSCMVI